MNFLYLKEKLNFITKTMPILNLNYILSILSSTSLSCFFRHLPKKLLREGGE